MITRPATLQTTSGWVVIIKDTRHLQEFRASQALLPLLAAMEHVEIMEKTPLTFDENGELKRP